MTSVFLLAALSLPSLAETTTKKALVQIAIEEMPPSRLTCSIRNVKTGFEVQTSWDPALSQDLVRTVLLDDDDGVVGSYPDSWAFTCWSEPFYQVVQPDGTGGRGSIDLSWTPSPEDAGTTFESRLRIPRDPGAEGRFLGEAEVTLVAPRLTLMAAGAQSIAEAKRASLALKVRLARAQETEAQASEVLERKKEELEKLPAESEERASAAFHVDVLSSQLAGLQAEIASHKEELVRLKGLLATSEDPKRAVIGIGIREVSVVARQVESTAGRLSLQPRQAPVSGRSLDAEIPDLVRDTFELLAEIAMERAREGSFELVAAKVEEAVCDGLVVGRMTQAEGAPQPLVDLAGYLAGPDDRLLPRTCEAVRGLTLAELGGAGLVIQGAIEQDLTAAATGLFRWALAHPGVELGDARKRMVDEHLAPMVVQLAPALVDIVTAREAPSGDQVLVVLDTLVRHPWVEEGGTPLPVECGLQIAADAALLCTNLQECGADRIRDILTAPAAYGSLLPHSANCLDEGGGRRRFLDRNSAQLAFLVSDLLRVLDPPADASTRDQLRLAVQVWFSALRFALVAADETPPADSKGAELVQVLGWFEGVVLAAIDEDPRALLTQGTAFLDWALGVVVDKLGDVASEEADETLAEGLEKHAEAVEKAQKAIRRARPIVTALTANASALATAEQDPARLEELRALRKQNLESLIEASTQRGQRGGEWVVSLGAPVGFQVPLRKASGLEVGLPMGVAVQRLPASPKPTAWRVGYHVQLSAVDLGRFLVTDADEPIAWNDFLVAGAQAGFLIGTPRNSLVVGLDGRYIPGGTDAGTASASVFASYYVPFYDLK